MISPNHFICQSDSKILIIYDIDRFKPIKKVKHKYGEITSAIYLNFRYSILQSNNFILKLNLITLKVEK